MVKTKIKDKSRKIFARSSLSQKVGELRSRLILFLVLSALGGMFLTPLHFLLAADNVLVTVNLNVATGALSITAPGAINFNNTAPGEIAVANSTTAGITTNDTRGSLAGWTVAGYFNRNFSKTTDGNVQMPLNQSGTLRLFWGANNGSGGSTITNVTGTSGDAIGGANNNFPGIGSSNTLTLMTNNGIDNGAGAFNMTNLKLNYNVPVNASAGSYQTDLILTIS